MIAAALKSRVVPPAELTEHERRTWEALQAGDQELASPFLSWPFAEAADRELGGVRVCVVEHDGRPAGFLPFQYRGGLGRVLGLGERVGGDLNDHFGLIAPAGLRVDPGRLLKLAGLNGLTFSHLDRDAQAQRGLVGERPEDGPVIVLHSGAEAYWQQIRERDRHFVADTDRCERKLVKTFGPLRLVFREISPLKELDRVIALKREQYARTGVADPLAGNKVMGLLRRLAQSDHSTCQGVLSTLWAGERWVASHFGLRAGPVLHYWFPVYDPDLRSFSPGRLLLKAMLMAPEAADLKLVDMGAGNSDAKRDFANGNVPVTRGLWLGSSIRAGACRVGLAVAWRLQALERQRVSAGGSPT